MRPEAARQARTVIGVSIRVMHRSSSIRQVLRRPQPVRRAVERLELHITHACNLTCDSCSHYSNHNHDGQLTLAEADRWMRLWSRRLAVTEFHLLGGEPTIHPDLAGFVTLARRRWPDAFIRIRTNGFFLHRHPGLPALLAADGRASISVAVHHDSAEYRAHLQPIFDAAGNATLGSKSMSINLSRTGRSAIADSAQPWSRSRTRRRAPAGRFARRGSASSCSKARSINARR
jgi:hypothetical protein